MGNKVLLNKDTAINLEKLIDSRLLVQANSGGGKSWLLRRLLEQSHGKVQQIVIDLEGEFSTLREKHDYIVAGKGGDVAANTKTAALLARKLLELNVSAIIDLYELQHQERKHFVKLFLDSVMSASKELWHPVLFVIDEAHVFVPEKGESEAAGAVIDLCTRGRKRGFCAVLATQRLSKLHKDAAAECNNKLIGRTGLDIDMKRAAEELGFTSKDAYLSLRNLEPGEFYTYGPALTPVVRKMTVGEVQTTHPKAGVKIVPTAPSGKVKAMLAKLNDLPQEAEQEARTVAELRAENARLKRDTVRTPQTAREVLETSEKIKREIHANVNTVLREKDEQIAGLTKELKKRQKILAQISYLAEVELKADILVAPPMVPVKASLMNQTNITKIVPKEKYVQSDQDSLTGPEQRILDAIAQLESIGVPEPEQSAVAFLAGYTMGGGGFNNPKGSLRTKGLIEYRNGNLALTDQGRELAKVPDGPLTTEELHQKVLSILLGPEKRLLQPLLERYPSQMSNTELAELSGYTEGSGGFNNPKGRLRTLGLVEYPEPGNVRARDILFL